MTEIPKDMIDRATAAVDEYASKYTTNDCRRFVANAIAAAGVPELLAELDRLRAAIQLAPAPSELEPEPTYDCESCFKPCRDGYKRICPECYKSLDGYDF